MYLLCNRYVLFVHVMQQVCVVCTCYVTAMCCMYLLCNGYVLYVPVL